MLALFASVILASPPGGTTAEALVTEPHSATSNGAVEPVAAWWTRMKRLDGRGPNMLGLNRLEDDEFGGVGGLVGSIH